MTRDPGDNEENRESAEVTEISNVTGLGSPTTKRRRTGRRNNCRYLSRSVPSAASSSKL